MFASIFPLLCLRFSLFFLVFAFRFSLFVLSLSLLVLLPCLSLWVVVSFSLADGFRHKKKGRKVFALRPLLSCCVCSDSCTVIEKLPRCVFGFFQLVLLVLPANAGSIGRLAGSHFDFLRHYVDITYNSSAFLK